FIAVRTGWYVITARICGERKGVLTPCAVIGIPKKVETYIPYFKKGLVDPWIPSDRWECQPYSACKDLPGSDIMVWVAKIVDQIEMEGKTDLMWAQEGQSTGIETKSSIKFSPNSLVARNQLTEMSYLIINAQLLLSFEI
ncbi:MAG: hypothetical protein ACKPKO_60795, partial [Candidatus Fonsibacter sp.]